MRVSVRPVPVKPGRQGVAPVFSRSAIGAAQSLSNTAMLLSATGAKREGGTARQATHPTMPHPCHWPVTSRTYRARSRTPSHPPTDRWRQSPGRQEGTRACLPTRGRAPPRRASVVLGRAAGALFQTPRSGGLGPTTASPPQAEAVVGGTGLLDMAAQTEDANHTPNLRRHV